MSARDIHHITPLAVRVRPISPAREAVEAAMQAAAGPLAADIIASRTGLRADDVRVILRNCCTKGLAYNAAPGASIGLYAWGQPPAAPRQPGLASARHPVRPADQHYHGEELRPFTGRPGAMDAFSFPSVVNGQRVERVRPMLIGGKPELLR